jgi:geranylgeranyl diphosphate synthase type II
LTTFSLADLQALIEQEAQRLDLPAQPATLYQPIHYIMKLGGKRVRPLLSLLAYQLWQTDPKPALQPALAVEVFHNFTLMHDDIMDDAPLRRGQTTVHEKWNANVAILSGDVMLVHAYQMLLAVPAEKLPEVLARFNRCARIVCEGQQLDMDFESRETVAEGEYLDMIARKTAELLGYSLWLGAKLAGADGNSCERLYSIGLAMGTGFQLMDDLLDVYAEPDKFGKQVGGDILANKKTYLLIKAQENCQGADKEQLTAWLQKVDYNPQQKVAAVTELYNRCGVKTLAEAKMQEYFNEGFAELNKLPVAEEKLQLLLGLFKGLAKRES